METVAVVNTTRDTVLGERISIAETSLSRMVGLLGKSGLEPGAGLLIIPSQAVHTVAMRFAIDVGIRRPQLARNTPAARNGPLPIDWAALEGTLRTGAADWSNRADLNFSGRPAGDPGVKDRCDSDVVTSPRLLRRKEECNAHETGTPFASYKQW